MIGCSLKRVWPDRRCDDCGHPAAFHRAISKVCIICTEPAPVYATKDDHSSK